MSAPARPRRRAGAVAARYLALDPERVLAPGLVQWDARGRIVSIRALRRQEARRVEDCAVLPGLVNSHAHLQLPALPTPERRFLPWVRQVIASRQQQSGPAMTAQARATSRSWSRQA